MIKSLGFVEGLVAGLSRRTDGPVKVFDWKRAAMRIKETGAATAEAGLREDWNYTSGFILRAGRIVPRGRTYTYLASSWATPTLILDGVEEPCWCVSRRWDAKTYWPKSARAILTGVA